MSARLDPLLHAHPVMREMQALDDAVTRSGLEPSLVKLVKLRASQINRCDYCTDMHRRAVREAGESEQRLRALASWREQPFYTARERAALEWAESLTLTAQTRAPDEAYAAVAAEFTAEEITKLSLVVAMINVWSRIAAGLRPPSPTPARH